MKQVYLKCHHGNLVRDCQECINQKEEIKKTIYNSVNDQEKDKKIPIQRGCDNELCFCTGRCKEVIGYME